MINGSLITNLIAPSKASCWGHRRPSIMRSLGLTRYLLNLNTSADWLLLFRAARQIRLCRGFVSDQDRVRGGALCPAAVCRFRPWNRPKHRAVRVCRAHRHGRPSIRAAYCVQATLQVSRFAKTKGLYLWSGHGPRKLCANARKQVCGICRPD